jgi:hypothetical protein
MILVLPGSRKYGSVAPITVIPIQTIIVKGNL